MVREDLRKVTTLHNELPIDNFRWWAGAPGPQRHGDAGYQLRFVQKLIQARCTSSTMPVPAYGAVRTCRRCSGGTVTLTAPDDGLAGRTIQPALKHIEFALPAHSCVKQTPQICNGAMRWSNIAEMCALFGPDPLEIPGTPPGGGTLYAP